MKKSTSASERGQKVFGYELKAWSDKASSTKKNTANNQRIGRIYFFGKATSTNQIKKQLADANVAEWVLDWKSESSHGDKIELQGEEGPIWIVKGQPEKGLGHHKHMLDKSSFGRARDLMGSLVSGIVDYNLNKLFIEFVRVTEDQVYGAMTGLEVGVYRFKRVRAKEKLTLPLIHVEGAEAALIKKAGKLGLAVNLARHLVNVPAGELHPESFAQEMRTLFQGSQTSKVDIWQEARLAKEKCGMILAVGQGSPHKPRLVHIKYRPKQRSKFKQPIAFVGKGVTFDTGGLDIKPSQYMRHMKKDMGGSASIAALAWWVEASGLKIPCDFWLAMSENSVDGHSFRPGDILQSRKGTKVEIHNTDAEGRLVLGDAIDVAINQKAADKPVALIDCATLTGAVRVGIGTMFAGLFSNDDHLADAIVKAGQKVSDPVWRLPLAHEYLGYLKSHVADMTNCAAVPYGGGITAALFLERFVGDMKWAHLDMMAWADKPSGAMSEVGGNGQMVQSLSRFMEHVTPDFFKD